MPLVVNIRILSSAILGLYETFSKLPRIFSGCLNNSAIWISDKEIIPDKN